MSRAIFFDDGRGLLAPLTDLRASFDVRVGALSNVERVSAALHLTTVAVRVPGDKAALVRDQHDVPVNQSPEGPEPCLAINGRCPFPLREIDELAPGESLVEEATGDLIAARLHEADVRAFMEGAAPPVRARPFDRKVLMSRPWDARAARDLALDTDLRMLTGARGRDIPAGVTVVGTFPVVIDPEAKIYPGVVIVAEDGPVVIAARAAVRPASVVLGPAYIGPRSTVLERAVIRPHSAIGPVCKVAGEIGGTVFQGYANKAHEGYLGDSWVGEWVNLGAGTTNSNLLNTYTEIVAQAAPGERRENTGEVFFGAVIGDHVKTAICTRLMTGSVLHIGSMFARTRPVSGCVPPFTWATDEGERFYRLSKFVDVMRTVMGRRELEPSEAYLARLSGLHARAAAQHDDPT